MDIPAGKVSAAKARGLPPDDTRDTPTGSSHATDRGFAWQECEGRSDLKQIKILEEALADALNYGGQLVKILKALPDHLKASKAFAGHLLADWVKTMGMITSPINNIP